MFRVMGFLLVLLAAAAQAGSDGFSRVTQQLTPRVHLIYRPIAINPPYEGNSIVIEQSDGLVVVDAGGAPPAGEAIVRQIKSFSDKPVKVLVYTHYHGDHNLGAGAFLKEWPGLRIVSTTATRANMTGKPFDYIKTYGKDYAGELEYAQQQLADPKLPPQIRAGWQQFLDVGDSIVAGYANLKTYPAMRTFHDRFDIPDPVTPIEVMFLGKANTDGDAVVWVPSERVLCSGDIVVSPIPYAAASYPKEWISVLHKLKSFDFAFLVPGHGEPMTDHGYVDKVIAALEDVRAQVGPLVAKGVATADIAKQTNFERVKTDFAGQDPWKRFLLSSFFLGSIIKNAAAEAKGEPIVQGTS